MCTAWSASPLAEAVGGTAQTMRYRYELLTVSAFLARGDGMRMPWALRRARRFQMLTFPMPLRRAMWMNERPWAERAMSSS